MIDFFFESVEVTKKTKVKKIMSKAIYTVLEEMGFKKNFYLSVLVTNNNVIKKINKKFRKINKPTNVLSFPLNQETVSNANKSFIILGDIVISLDKIASESNEYRKSFNSHLSHMTAHALLHIFGFQHENEKDFFEMKDKEISVLAKLSISSPY